MKAAIVVFMLFCCSVITSYCLAQGFGASPLSVASEDTFKIAILPWEIITPARVQEIRDVIFAGTEKAITSNAAIKLEYSYYREFPSAKLSKTVDESVVPKKLKKKLWKGTKPDLDLVVDVAKKLGVNGALVCRCRVQSGPDAIGCHAIEVSNKRSFNAKRTTEGFLDYEEGLGAVRSAIEEVLEKMLSVGSARTPGSKVATVFG